MGDHQNKKRNGASNKTATHKVSELVVVAG